MPRALVLALALAACGDAPPDAVVRVAVGDVPRTLSAADVAVIERHVRASPRWEVREERGKRHAIRKERSREGPGAASSLLGGWDASLHGFYSSPDDDRLQTRVAIGLGEELGFGRRAVVTRLEPGARAVQVGLRRQSETGAAPLWASYVVVPLGAGASLEIFEESTRKSRAFTERALREIGAELRAALQHRAEILAKGHAAELVVDPPLRHGAPVLEVAEGMQPGIYVVTAWVSPGEDGSVRTRAVFVGPDPAAPSAVPPELAGHASQALSVDRSGEASVRFVGWGPDRDVLYPYQTEYTIYEGDWQHRYLARFELWLTPASGGPARKLAETTRVIAGWMR